jgi:hypothetical protein
MSLAKAAFHLPSAGASEAFRHWALGAPAESAHYPVNNPTSTSPTVFKITAERRRILVSVAMLVILLAGLTVGSLVFYLMQRELTAIRSELSTTKLALEQSQSQVSLLLQKLQINPK